MSEKKILYVIPHTHWDREWYMSFEQHRVQLVHLLDTLIETMEENPRFNVYHLDGQYIPIEDYLEIRPQMRERLEALVRADRIQIGPWYVLQDEYFTSGEANVRNMLYGMQLCRKLGGDPVKCGYFPDSFGNISQAPQLLRGFGIDNAVFGRGLGEVRYNNEIVPGQKSSQSEIRWRSPDGSEVIGIVFAHWYNNLMDLPSDPAELKTYLQEALAAAEESAVTPHLLGMNGCDHTPVQVNLPDILDTARNLFPEVEIRQSGFKEYAAKLRPYADTFPVIEGELRGQFTSGNCQLVSTASSHIPLKQQNHRGQNALEKEAEPLNVLSHLAGDEYRSDLLLYSWKKLMQNHPHDSICSCSVDEVTQEMKTRFDKSLQVAECVRDESMDYLVERIGTKGDANLVVFHTSPLATTETLTALVDLPDGSDATSITLYDAAGKAVPATVRHLGRTFTYKLPRDHFRIPYFVNRFEVTMTVTMTGIGWQTYTVKPGTAAVDNGITVHDNGAENEHLSFAITANGEIELTDKHTGKVYRHLNGYDNTGDCGNLYNFVPVKDGETYTTRQDTAVVTLHAATPAYVTFAVENHIYVPAGLTENEQRTAEGAVMTVTSYVTLRQGMRRLEFATTFTNVAENYRLRAVFAPEIKAEHSLASTPFDVTEREIHPWSGWTYPTLSHRAREFFALEGEDKALLVASRGLYEYEIDRENNAMTLNILRSIGRIGDWGEFPAPDGFCKRTMTVEYAVVPYVKEDRFTAYQDALAFSNPAVAGHTADKHAGSLPTAHCLMAINGDTLAFSACKKCESGEGTILRLYNLSDQETTVTLTADASLKALYEVDLKEDRDKEIAFTDETKLTVGGKKIYSLELNF